MRFFTIRKPGQTNTSLPADPASGHGPGCTHRAGRNCCRAFAGEIRDSRYRRCPCRDLRPKNRAGGCHERPRRHAANRSGTAISSGLSALAEERWSESVSVDGNDLYTAVDLVYGIGVNAGPGAAPDYNLMLPSADRS